MADAGAGGPPRHPCPSCGRGLSLSTGGGRRHRFCGGCGGRAIHDWRLGPPLPAPLVERLKAALDAGGRRGHRRCPLCRSRFIGIRVELPAGPLALEACDHCRLIWFDGGEHEAAAGRGPPPPPTELDGLPPVAAAYAGPRSLDVPVDVTGRFLDGTWKDLPALLGFPVEEGEAPPSRAPVTWTLAGAITVATVLAMVLGSGHVLRDRGLAAAHPFRHGGLDLVSSFLLHGGIWHLLGNLWFLLSFGDDVEEELGPGPFFLLVVLATLAGDLLFVLFEHGTAAFTVGASGGISGVIVFYALAFPRRRLRVLSIVYFMPLSWEFTARAGIVAWVLLNIVGGFMVWAGLTYINYLPHLGGAGTGAAAWWWMRKATTGTRTTVPRLRISDGEPDAWFPPPGSSAGK